MTPPPLRLAVIGASGRMGQTLIRQLKSRDIGTLVAAVCSSRDRGLGRDVGDVAGVGPLGVPLSVDVAARCDVVIEFTNPAGLVAWSAWAAQAGIAYVSGTTGLAPPAHGALTAAAQRVPVLWSSNMSIGVAILNDLLRQAARALQDWDIEIVESHHRHKADAPSGTAGSLLQAACAARGVDPLDVATYGRFGQIGARQAGEIGVHALRLGGIVGEHHVCLASPDETLRLSHRAETRDVFAAGALRAARWLVGRPAGLYTLADTLRH